MKTRTIHASTPYEVVIGAGLLEELGSRTAAVVKGRTAVVVSDDQVFEIYGEKAENSLKNSGFFVKNFVLPHGEQSKNGENFLKLVNFLAENRLTRTDVIVALGGGVTGDLAGFAAACYLRGIACVQVPTSLLAMVDSSVGGKTAIDLPAGKNLCGAFHQPALVICDPELLNTLPAEFLTDGMAEVIKYAVLGQEGLFALLKNGIEHWEQVIYDCVCAKAKLVEADEFDNGSRQFLNLGHTLGHSLELGSNFALSHGSAVAIGMAMMAKAACKKEMLTSENRDEIVNLLKKYNLPTETDQSREAICKTALGDKKRRGDTITLVVPVEKDECKLHPIPVEQLLDWCHCEA